VPAAHTCNPSYSEAKIRRITIGGQLGQRFSKTLSQKYPTHKIQKGWWSGSSESICLANVRPLVQILLLPEKKRKKKTIKH
jgi:hypothetical protein